MILGFPTIFIYIQLTHSKNKWIQYLSKRLIFEPWTSMHSHHLLLSQRYVVLKMLCMHQRTLHTKLQTAKEFTINKLKNTLRSTQSNLLHLFEWINRIGLRMQKRIHLLAIRWIRIYIQKSIKRTAKATKHVQEKEQYSCLWIFWPLFQNSFLSTSILLEKGFIEVFELRHLF